MTETPRPTQTPAADLASGTCALTFDATEYCHFLADCDWTEEQKLEFIGTLWQIIIGFVDLGFDLHPIQQVIDSQNTLAADSVSMLEFPHKLNILETTDAVLAAGEH